MAQEKKGPVTLLQEQFQDAEFASKKLQEEYLRAVADFDNLRKRTQRDSEVSRRFALEALVMDLLPALDNFGRAAQTSSTVVTTEGLQKGMDLINRQLLDALRKHGVEEYSCVGVEFDPRRAEAISFVHTSEHKPGMVVSETSKGYACGDRVLRPARVVVAKAAEAKQQVDTGSRAAEAAVAPGMSACTPDQGVESKPVGEESAGEQG
jgi:molecular chaperone GrpE